MEKIKLVEILTEARQVLRGRWGKAVSVSVCLLLILLAVACLRFVNPLLYTAAYLLIAVQVVAGAQYIYLDMTRDEPTGLGRLFPPLRLYLPILGIFLLTVIACFIGICLFIVPGFVLSLGLSMSLYILRDRPELGVFGSMNASWKMMNGHKTELFLLSLRLVGFCCVSSRWVSDSSGFILMPLRLQLAFTNVSKARGWGQSSLIVTYHLPEDRTNSFWLVKGRKLNTRFFPPGFF